MSFQKKKRDDEIQVLLRFLNAVSVGEKPDPEALSAGLVVVHEHIKDLQGRHLYRKPTFYVNSIVFEASKGFHTGKIKRREAVERVMADQNCTRQTAYKYIDGLKEKTLRVAKTEAKATEILAGRKSVKWISNSD